MTKTATQATSQLTEKEEKQARQQQLNDLCAIMDIPEGRRFVGRILAKGRLYQTSFAGHSNQTIFNEGMRNMACWLFYELDEACADKVLLMMQENKEHNDG